MADTGLPAHQPGASRGDTSSAVQACFDAALDEIRMLERSLAVVLERERRLATRLAGVERDRDRMAAEVAQLHVERTAPPAMVVSTPSIAWRAPDDGVAEDAEPRPTFADRAFWPDENLSRRRSFLRLLGTTTVQVAVTIAAMASLLALVG